MITKRVVKQKKRPLPKTESPFPSEPILPPHYARRRELSKIHGIPTIDIFVDPKNGVELYRTASGGWVTNPAYREVN
jgi:hypothetical protein